MVMDRDCQDIANPQLRMRFFGCLAIDADETLRHEGGTEASRAKDAGAP